MDSNINFWFASFTFLLILITFFLVLRKRSYSRKQLPPGWPLIGNILDVGSNPHQSSYKLKFKYGDLLWLRLGWTNTLVIQTAKAAEQLFKHHDASFCDRKVPESWTSHNFTEGSIAFGRYTPSWRILRRLVTSGLMTNKQIQETACVRRKCIDDMIQFIQEDSAAAQCRGESGEVEFSKYVFIMTFNIVGNLVFSRDLVNSQSEEGNDFFHAMDKVTELGGKPNLADFFPFLRRFDPQRIKKNMEEHLGRTMSIIKKFVMERIEDRKLMKQRDNKDLLDTLLEYNESDDARKGHEMISTHNMLIIIMEMFFGGTETTSSTTEWVMTELFRNPESMRRVKEELNRVVGLKRNVEESDIDQLPYLQAVIKESMRLHPALPLLVPRNALEDTNFMGYVIPKDTQVFVNTWAIGRDSEVWEDPLSFKPERFLGSNVQYMRGQNFELLPFGSGRRICVGYPLAHQIIHLTVASLIHYFDWEIDSNSTMDMNERFGFTVRKLIPLRAIPKRRSWKNDAHS
ncbi:iridoid oxidase-like [Euphorbia lathyris]|uniref:iridoid oxidase-like n=1 Tax=Euphorbia lathyris TaxID=212925 RepID=UPI003313B9B1